MDLALPKTEHSPPFCPKPSVVLPIPRDVPLDVVDPVAGVVAARELLEASVEISSAPEVAVAEDHQGGTVDDDVRLAGEARHGDPIAAAAAPQRPT